jgi:thiol-disulfide isomerase/thioredoxin
MKSLLSITAILITMIPAKAQTGVCKTEKKDMFSGEFGRVFEQEYSAYGPDESMLNRIDLEDVRVIVVLGLWCEDSQREVPRFLKIAENAAMSRVTAEYHQVNREKFCSDPAIQALKVGYVPTLIFFRKEQEVGRIVESTEKSLEEDMLKILGRKKS